MLGLRGGLDLPLMICVVGDLSSSFLGCERNNAVWPCSPHLDTVLRGIMGPRSILCYRSMSIELMLFQVCLASRKQFEL